MHKIVIDTNILVSALLSPFGPPARVLDLVLGGNLQICFDSRILTEYETVLLRPKFGFDRRDVETLIDYLSTTGISVVPAPTKAFMPDESDRTFYEVAKHCNAWLVTGNLKHFPDDRTAISPTEFLNTMK